MDVIKREEYFNISLDNLSDNKFFKSDNEVVFYTKEKLTKYIIYYTNDIKTSLDKLFEINQLI